MARLQQQGRQSFGFTIVELLIVIVVIGILAAIVVVAYNGIQSKAMATRVVSDLSTINKYVQSYYAMNGSYPTLGGAWGYTSAAHPGAYVPGIVPDIAPSLPTPAYPDIGNDSSWTQTYGYISDGTNYKVIAHGSQYDTLCETVKSQNPKLIDPIRDCWAFGYWTPGAANW